MLLDVSEKPYNYMPEKNTLRFNLKYENDETRVVWFELKIDYYTNAMSDDIPYIVEGGPLRDSGTVTGPTLPS